MLHLVLVELTEIRHVHLAQFRIDNSGESIQFNLLDPGILHGDDDVAQLADARRFDQDSLRLILVNDLFQSRLEIPHQSAANAAGIHLIYLNARILQKASVDSDLSEFILDQNQLLIVGFLDQLSDQCRLTGA